MSQDLSYDDHNEAQACISRALGVAEMIGPWGISTLGYETAVPLCNAMWALSQQLERLATIFGMDPPKETEGKS